MKVKILGTAACEAWPGLFCNCETCKKVREIKGKDVRSRASILVDDSIMVDFGYDNFMHWAENDIDMTKIKDIFITHNHCDHFVPYELRMLSLWFSGEFRNERVTLHGNHDVIIRTLEKPLYERNKLYLHEICPFDIIKCNDGYTVTSIKAEHCFEKTNEMNYIFEKEGKTFVYLTDTGLYKDENTWNFLSNYKFDCIISECTSGWLPNEPYYYHQTFEGVKIAKEKFISLGCIKEDTPYYLTHFSHNCGMLHSEMVERAEPFGFTICYDGMDIFI